MLELELCKRTDPRYSAMRDRHYIPNRGAHGQQLHFLVMDDDVQVGIISGGSGVYSVAARDAYFGIPSDKTERETFWLPAIVNNTVFRLEQTRPNLGTQVLSLWRRTTARLWEEFYGVPVIGFESFIIPAPHRKGSMYLADNWVSVGETAGWSKQHTSAGGAKDARQHVATEKKLTLVRWRKRPVQPTHAYRSCWRRETPEEREAAKRLARLQNEYRGRRFSR